MFKEMVQPTTRRHKSTGQSFSLERSIQDQTNTLTELIHNTNHIAATVTTQLKPQSTFYYTAPTCNLEKRTSPYQPHHTQHPLSTTRPTEEDKHFHPPSIDCTRVKNSTVLDQQQQQHISK